MKNVILLFILFCLFFSCKSNNEINLKIKEAEELIRTEQPDSAFALLDGITNPEVLSDKVFAHFCMVSAGLSEQLGEDIRSCRKWSEQMIITKSMVLRKIR
ncbi:hypothetical protein [Parabacteroides goldsteinii]|uniref:hypothetical protein n=1 Tax=Parabacteroides goldsteinii TaxID=328812 RepID=UPI0025868BFA|nr:hypothetical protein [Parabacteroides goldsteinii]